MIEPYRRSAWERFREQVNLPLALAIVAVWGLFALILNSFPWSIFNGM